MTPTTSTTSEPEARLGLTLIELLVVVAIIGIIAGLTIGAVAKIRTSAQRKQTLAILSLVVDALNAYRADWGWYPPDNNGPVATSEQHYGIKNLQIALGGHPVCSRCGYVYERHQHDGVPLKDPRRATWACPRCGASRDRFALDRTNYLENLDPDHIGRGRPNLDLDHDGTKGPEEITAAILDAWGQPLKYETLYNKKPKDPAGPDPSETYDESRWGNEYFHFEAGQYVLYSYGPD